jgi:hypothetical protein
MPAPYKVVQFRRGSTPETELFTGAPGELTVDIDKWTAVIHDGVTAGGHPLRLAAAEFPRVRYLLFRAASVQQGYASLGFSSPANNGPLAVAVVENSGLITGVASFDPVSNQSIQDHFLLPLNWVNPLSVDIVWRTNTTIGSVIWLLETCCVPVRNDSVAGTKLEDAAFGTAQSVTTITSGIPNVVTTSSLAIDTSQYTYEPNSEVFFRLTRDGGDDTIDVPVELLSLRFSILIQEL